MIHVIIIRLIFFRHKYNTNTMFVLHNDTCNNNTFDFFRHKYNTNTMFVLHKMIHIIIIRFIFFKHKYNTNTMFVLHKNEILIISEKGVY